MKAPDWWWRPRAGVEARLLAPLGAAYGALTLARMGRHGRRAGVPVLCVGNLVAGGAGKTPTAIALAELLRAQGSRPAFLSRGYGRTRPRDRSAVLRVDPARHGAGEAGDEPLLLAAVAPTFVSADRRAAAARAIAEGADALLLDDGLQSPALVKDWSVAVVDGRTGIGNGLCLPAGPLRAPVARSWPFVSAVCLVGDGEPGRRVAALARAALKPVFTASLHPDPAVVGRLRGARLYAFAGIGRPSKLTDSLRGAGLEVVGMRAFPDHHRFSAADLRDLRETAVRLGGRLVTTAKDRARLPPGFPAEVLPVRLVFDRPEDMAAEIARFAAVTSSR